MKRDMAIITTKAQYENGVVTLLEKPRFDPDEVVVTFVKYEKPAEIEEDPDEALFRKIEPQYRKIRREVFKERFPKLYEKYYGSISQSSD